MKKDAVIYLSPWGKVTGSLIDSLEYLIAMKKAGIAVRFIYMGRNPGLPGKLIADRYILDFDPLEDALFLPLRWQIAGQRFEKVLLPYNTYRRIFWWLRSAETFVLPSMWMRRDARWPMGFPVERGKVTYLLNPKQHSYRLRHIVPYEKKLLLDCLRAPAKVHNNLLVNCQSAHKQHSAEEIHKATEGAQHDKILVLTGKKQAAYYGKAGFTALRPPVKDLFAQFNQYLYLPAIDGYDENPRLLIESVSMGKKIIFPEEKCTDPYTLGKYHRLKQSTESFQIKADDFILQQFGQVVP